MRYVREAGYIEPFEFSEGRLTLVPQTLDGGLLVFDNIDGMGAQTPDRLTREGVRDLIVYLTYWETVMVQAGLWDA